MNNLSKLSNSDLLELYKIVTSYLNELNTKKEALEVQNVR